MTVNKKIKLYVVDFERNIVRRIDELFTRFPQYNIKFIGSSHNYSSCINDAGHWEEADVFLISAYLSDMMGFELIKPIRSKNPNAKIIISVKSNTLNHAEEAMRKGANKVLTKPITAGELIETIHDLMGILNDDSGEENTENLDESDSNNNSYPQSFNKTDSNDVNDEDDEESYLHDSYMDENQVHHDDYFTKLIEENIPDEEEIVTPTPKPKTLSKPVPPPPQVRRNIDDIYNPVSAPLYKKEEDDFLGKKPNNVVVFSSTSSSGKTSLIVNIAIAINKFSQYKPKIVLVDFNLLFPSIFLKFHHNDMILCKKNIYELIEDIDDLSDELIEEALITHEPTGIKILNTPRDVVRAQEINKDIIEKIITHLRTMFDLILIDTSSNFELPSNSFPLVISDKNIVVLEPDVTSVLHTGRLIELIQNIEKNMGTNIIPKTQFVLNKQKNKPLIELEDIKETLSGSEIRFIIPEDFKIIDYGNNGLSIIDYPSTATKHIKELARSIYPFETEFSIANKNTSPSPVKSKYNAPKYNTSRNSASSSDNQWLITLLLSIFLGGFGAHRFYNGKIGSGIAMLLTLGGLGIWNLLDLINIIMGKFTDRDGNPITH